MGGPNNGVRFVRVAAVSAVVACAGAAWATGPSFTVIPPAAGEVATFAYSVSGNGRHALGSSNLAGGGKQYWTWTPEGGRVNLVSTPEFLLESIRAIANDGTTAGTAIIALPPAPIAATRRLPGGTSTALGPLVSAGESYRFISTYAISDDASTVIGDAQSPIHYQAWVSRNGSAPTGLGWLEGSPGSYSTAQAVNADGSVIVGTSTSAGAAVEFRGGTVRFLADPTSDITQSNAYAVTASGDYILGSVYRGGISLDSAVIWGPDRTPIEIGNPTPLGEVPGLGFAGIADGGQFFAAAALGSTAATRDSWVWSAGHGYQRLTDFALDNGVAFPSTLIGVQVGSMSRDGLTFAGSATNEAGISVGWVLTVPSVGAPTAGVLVALLSSPRRRRRE